MQFAVYNPQRNQVAEAQSGVLWSKWHFISTIENISAETVKKYIEEQTLR